MSLWGRWSGSGLPEKVVIELGSETRLSRLGKVGLEAECVFSGAESEMHVLLLFGRLGLAGWAATRQRGLGFRQDMSVTFLERFDVTGKVLAL